MTNPSTPIPTPRVDALDFEDQMKFPGTGYGELWELARNLERELTQAMEDRDEARGLYMKFEGDEEENYRKIARLTQELDHERNAHAELQARCYDNGFPTGSSIFDEYEAIKRELQQALAELSELQHHHSQLKEAYEAKELGVPIGPLVGAHTIANQQREISRLQTELAAARAMNEKLLDYVQHRDSCDYPETGGFIACTCGLEELLK